MALSRRLREGGGAAGGSRIADGAECPPGVTHRGRGGRRAQGAAPWSVCSRRPPSHTSAFHPDAPHANVHGNKRPPGRGTMDAHVPWSVSGTGNSFPPRCPVLGRPWHVHGTCAFLPVLVGTRTSAHGQWTRPRDATSPEHRAASLLTLCTRHVLGVCPSPRVPSVAPLEIRQSTDPSGS